MDDLGELKLSNDPAQPFSPNLMTNNNFKVYQHQPQSQTTVILGLLWWFLCFSFIFSSIPLFSFALYIPTSRPFALLYIGWMVYDRNSMYTGRSTYSIYYWFWSNPLWHGFAQYFPCTLIKTHDLDPTKKYIFGFHPHGFYGLSLFAAVYNKLQFNSLFPGIDVYGITLPVNFYIPIWREFLLCFGLTDSSASSIRGRLNNGQKGTALLISTGGKAEFKHMKKGTFDLVLKKRKGFIKIALQTGADLVPILGFGENDLYDPIEDGIVKEILNYLMYKIAKASAPLVWGRYYTLLPQSHPINVVVGTPIPVKMISHPTQLEIDEYHEKYLNGVKSLYDQFKDKYHTYRIKDLEFIE